MVARTVGYKQPKWNWKQVEAAGIGAERFSAAVPLASWVCRFFVMRQRAALGVLAGLFWADAERTSLLTVIIENGSEETKCPSGVKWLLEVTDKSLCWSSSKRENFHSQAKDSSGRLIFDPLSNSTPAVIIRPNVCGCLAVRGEFKPHVSWVLRDSPEANRVPTTGEERRRQKDAR